MARYVTSIATTMSPAAAFAYMVDVKNFAEWDPSVKHVQRLTGDGQSVGSAYELTVVAGGTSVMRYDVTQYEAPRRVVLVSRTRFLTSIDEIRVKPSPAGCVVTYDAKLSLNGALKLFDPVLGLAFQRLGDRAAAGLRRVLGATR
jgi:carbon monoxide dehydrogenase subunit G